MNERPCPIPWDRDLSLQAFANTVKAVVSHRDMFRRFPHGSVGRAWWFAGIAHALVALTYFGFRQLPHEVDEKYPNGVFNLSDTAGFAIDCVHVLVLLVVPACAFHLLARAAGGTPDFKRALRATAYLQAVALFFPVGSFLPDPISHAWMLGCAGLVFVGWVRFAESSSGLSRTKAIQLTLATGGVTTSALVAVFLLAVELIQP